MTNEELLNKTISFLRFPLTVGVVFIHFNLAEHGFTIHGVTYGLDHPAWYDFLINFFSEVLPQIGVPLFFIISGFLFFYRVDFDSNVYQKKLRKRVRTLLIPYLLWNLIAILVHAMYQISFLFPNATQEEMHFSFMRILKTFFANIPNEGIFVMPAEDAVTAYSGFIYPINLPMYKNLIKLVSNSWVDGFYSRPRTDRKDLEKYHEDLIVCSACIAGEVPAKILKGDIAGAREAIEWHKRLWGDDYYLVKKIKLISQHLVQQIQY